MTVFKLVRFPVLLNMNWHFVAKAILGNNGAQKPHSIAPSLWIIFVTYRVRVTTSPLKFDGGYIKYKNTVDTRTYSHSHTHIYVICMCIYLYIYIRCVYQIHFDNSSDWLQWGYCTTIGACGNAGNWQVVLLPLGLGVYNIYLYIYYTHMHINIHR